MFLYKIRLLNCVLAEVTLLVTMIW